jgi:hypothetical protein
MGLSDVLAGGGNAEGSGDGAANAGGAGSAGGEGAGGTPTLVESTPSEAAGSGAGGSGGEGEGDGGGAAGSGASHWLTTSRLSDETREWAAKKGFDKAADPGLVLESYHQLEKLKRVADAELLRIPAETALDSEPMQELFGKLGRPEKAELGEGGYQLPEIPGVEPDDDVRPHFAKWAHEAGLNNDQAAAVMNHFVEFSQEAMKAQAEAFAMEEAEAMTALRKEWGAAFDERKQAATAAIGKLGLSGDDVDAMARSLGSKRTMEILAGYGVTTGEHRIAVEGGATQPAGAMTPAQAKEKIGELMDNPAWKEGWAAGDPRKVEEMMRLHRLAAGVAA